MSRWLALKRSDDSLEKYAVGFVSHTVCKTVVGGKQVFEAWRVAAEFVESVQLGVFTGENAFELAKLCVENDARELLAKKAAA